VPRQRPADIAQQGRRAAPARGAGRPAASRSGELAMSRRSLQGAAALLCAAVALSACGGSSKPAVCGKRDNLKQAVDSLTQVNPLKDGTDEVKSRVSDVQSAANELADAAGDQYKTQANDVKAAVAALTNDVKGLTGSDKTASLSALPTDVQQLTNSLD